MLECVRLSLSVCTSSEILLDILPTMQTSDSAKTLIDLIRDETIRGTRSRVSLSAMSLSAVPTPEISQSLLVSATRQQPTA